MFFLDEIDEFQGKQKLPDSEREEKRGKAR
jgi:hypothetical protein